MKVYTLCAGVIDLACPEDIQRLDLSDLEYGCWTRRRFGAQVPWTVHQHSLLVGLLATEAEEPVDVVAKCYLHDLSEGLLGDMQKPIRDLLSPYCPWEQAHTNICQEIARQMGQDWPVGWEESPPVRFHDHRAFEIEVQTFISRDHWEGFFGTFLPAPPTDRERDLMRSLQGLRYGIVHSTEKVLGLACGR